MRAYVFVYDSNDEQTTILHETGTGELRNLDFLTLESRAFITNTVWRGVAVARRPSRSLLSHPFPAISSLDLLY